MGKLGYKGLLLLGGMMMLGGAAQAQYLRSSYFMEGTSARLQLNPGLQPTKGYFNMPIIGSLNMSMGHTTKRFFQWSGKMGERL